MADSSISAFKALIALYDQIEDRLKQSEDYRVLKALETAIRSAGFHLLQSNDKPATSASYATNEPNSDLTPAHADEPPCLLDRLSAYYERVGGPSGSTPALDRPRQAAA